MKVASLIRIARRRAGLTQRELANRLGTHQPVIARWETGQAVPDCDTVARVVRACGFELNISLTPADEQDLALIRRELSLSPEERLARMVQATNAINTMAEATHA